MRAAAVIAIGAAAPFVAACAPVETSVLLNELTWQGGGKLELAGTTSASVDLSGWTVRREVGGLGFTFASGVTLAPGAHLVLTQPTDPPFALSKNDSVILEDQTGLRIDQVLFDDNQAEVSYCRVPDAEGPWALCARPTFGEANPP